jgi:hypothetical protein
MDDVTLTPEFPMLSRNWTKVIASILLTCAVAIAPTGLVAQNKLKCYIITQDAIVYHAWSGTDPTTAPECKPVTSEIETYLQAYEAGKRPKRIDETNTTFFDPVTGTPIVWYSEDTYGSIELFGLMGFHPETGEELRPITREIVKRWKAQVAETKRENSRRVPQRIDPKNVRFFDSLTGKPRVWYARTSIGEYEFYDADGYDPRTGDKLIPISTSAIEDWIKHQSDRQWCYVVTREGVEYRDSQPGIDRLTGLECRPLTDKVLARL